MDAALGWEIAGSAAAVIAIPTTMILGVAQLRSSRQDVDSRARREQTEPLATRTASDHTEPATDESNLVHMRATARLRDFDQLRLLAVSNPAAAVLATWRTLRYLIYKEAYSGKCAVSEDWNTQLPLIAQRMGADWKTRVVIGDLQEMRDRSERGRVISRSDALEYVDAAETVLTEWLGQDQLSVE